MLRARLERLRWRRRGAWMWPTFALVVAVVALEFVLLPPVGDGTNVVEGLLIAVALCLVLVAVVAPLLGLWRRRRRPDLPRLVARDQAGTALLLATAGLLLLAGVVHAPDREADRQAYLAQSAAVRGYVERRAPDEFRTEIARADTLDLGGDLYRTCVPSRRDDDRALCLFVFTDQSPPGLREDPNRAPNESYVPGRRP